MCNYTSRLWSPLGPVSWQLLCRKINSQNERVACIQFPIQQKGNMNCATLYYSDFQVGRYDILLQTTIDHYYVISYQIQRNYKESVQQFFVHLLHPSLASLTCESAVTLEVWLLPKAMHCFAAWRHRRQQFPRFVAYVANQLHLLLAVLHPKKTMCQTYLVTEVCMFTSAYYFHFDLKLPR